MAEDARIGYPPVRVWGCPTTAMWVYRLGAEKAKRMLFTGDKITGNEAAALGLVLKAVPADRLDEGWMPKLQATANEISLALGHVSATDSSNDEAAGNHRDLR